MNRVQLESIGKCHPKESRLCGVGWGDKAVIRLHPQQQWTYMQITDKENNVPQHINVKRDCLVLHLSIREFMDLFDIS